MFSHEIIIANDNFYLIFHLLNFIILKFNWILFIFKIITFLLSGVVNIYNRCWGCEYNNRIAVAVVVIRSISNMNLFSKSNPKNPIFVKIQYYALSRLNIPCSRAMVSLVYIRFWCFFVNGFICKTRFCNVFYQGRSWLLMRLFELFVKKYLVEDCYCYW